MASERHPKLCIECSKPVIHSARAKTCSEQCRKEHQRKVKRALYEQHRETERFKELQAKRVTRRKERRAADPEFDAQAAAAQKKAVQKSVAKRNADPGRMAAHLEKMRAWKAAADDAQKEKFRESSRRWYSGLSDEERAELIRKGSENRRKRGGQKG